MPALPLPALALTVTSAVALLCASTPASAATAKASWQMDEAPGAAVMHDSSGNGLDGTIGSHVRVGVLNAGHKGYRFPFVTNNPSEPADPQHLVSVPDNPALNPGLGAYTITLTTRFGPGGDHRNLVEKGQSGFPGGFFKVETAAGNINCLFRGDAGSPQVRSGKLDDNRWHTLVCSRTATGLTLTVDGKVVDTNTRPSGNIANTAPLTIGGKPKCSQATVQCDYFAGYIDKVIIS
jgi:hypothetical protein